MESQDLAHVPGSGRSLSYHSDLPVAVCAFIQSHDIQRHGSAYLRVQRGAAWLTVRASPGCRRVRP